ncbi:MAG: zinc-dependent metalloprotease [Bryobacterales bacterium]
MRLTPLLLAAWLATAAIAAEPTPTIEQKTEGLTRTEGFLPFYWDAKAGKVWLEIGRFDEDLLYVEWLSRGLGYNPIGLDRAQLGQTAVVRFRRIGPKIFLEEPNQRYRALTDDADERRAVAESFASSVLWGFSIAAETGGRVLVDATPFLLRDSHDVIGTLKSSSEGDYKLDEGRSTPVPERTKGFPKNTELEAMLSFTGTRPGRGVRETTPTPEAVTLYAHHSFVEAPGPGYEPRQFDPRAGVGSITFADYASPLDQPLEKRWIRRHRLAKKDPSAAVSEAVEPIVYYLDRGAPEPVRSALLDGARWWNQAFEAAGYKDAFRVELLPEDADPLDVRYNVINWVHRSTRGWSYGASVTDPRTGEIVKGVVSLGSLRVRQDRLLFEGLIPQYACAQAAGPAAEALAAATGGEAVTTALARIRQLSAHEVGHTLGFPHNYAASSYDRGSVMDYPAPRVKITPDEQLDLSDAYGVGIGEWDKMTVRYAYSDFAPGADEAAELEKILAESQRRGLLFITDADARPLGAPHPLASLWDEGTDPVAELDLTMQVRRLALEKFSEASVPEGTPLSELELTLTPLYLHHRYQVEAAAKSLAGMEFSFAVRGGGAPPVRIVPPAKQRAALEALLRTLDPRELVLPDRLLAILPPAAFGYPDRRETFESREGRMFDPLAAAAVAADVTLSAILGTDRAARLVDFHARDAEQPSLDEVIDALMRRLWSAEAPADPREQAVRREAGYVLLDRLMDLADDPAAPPEVRTIAEAGLAKWESSYGEAWPTVERFLRRPSREAARPRLLPAPPGSPIGAR